MCYISSPTLMVVLKWKNIAFIWSVILHTWMDCFFSLSRPRYFLTKHLFTMHFHWIISVFIDCSIQCLKQHYQDFQKMALWPQPVCNLSEIFVTKTYIFIFPFPHVCKQFWNVPRMGWTMVNTYKQLSTLCDCITNVDYLKTR